MLPFSIPAAERIQNSEKAKERTKKKESYVSAILVNTFVVEVGKYQVAIWFGDAAKAFQKSSDLKHCSCFLRAVFVHSSLNLTPNPSKTLLA